ncbi:MAG: Fis family transcriptional regulator [Alphaproteobacteria bacterium]|jgi:two-component system nitrogen regulation response regulator GlnG|nr:Fis family transcriptional regulator [Alphaproteobacteria bacterium]MCV6599021.1 Fis family transcriptional regulator [Alphaproteobacteria bacterium]
MSKGVASCIKEKLNSYFYDLHGTCPRDLYASLLKEFDYSLIDVVLTQTKGNKVKTAEILGINRNTLSKKMKDLNIDAKNYK